MKMPVKFVFSLSCIRFAGLFTVVAVLWCTTAALESTAQPLITDLIVETYYISDANDATDTNGGMLEEGSITYRVYLELAEGSKLVEFFANANHTFFIKSTAPFFNNEDRGETFGFDIRANRLDENTVALDSWLSFGQASRQHLGVLKEDDDDGSIIGGENNDGGSAGIEGGLLINNDAAAGPALTISDGLIPWPEPGFAGFTFFQAFDDPAVVFGNETSSNEFITNNMRINTANGVAGPNNANRILIAQLTTLGELEMELNVVVEDALGNTTRYVAAEANPNANEQLSPFLSYPPECGCTDPNFIEYNAAAPCDDGSCATLAVIGCTDPDACNFNSNANFSIPELCCYSPTECNGLDWTIICPTLSLDDSESGNWRLYPNPVVQFVHLEFPSTEQALASVEIFALDGRKVFDSNITSAALASKRLKLDAGNLPKGIYLLRVLDTKSEIVHQHKFIKVH